MARARIRLGALAILALTLGALLRLWFLHHASIIAGDTLLYADIAQSWRHYGIYGFAQAEGPPLPTLIRLPGYPLFLVLCFQLFGPANFRAVIALQCVLDLLAALLLAALARRLFGPRAALAALALAALCPFTAAWVAVPLTETLTCATITLAFYALVRWREAAAGSHLISRETDGTTPNPAIFKSAIASPWNRWFFILSAALAYSILLRPDQVLLAVAILPAMLWLTTTSSIPHPQPTNPDETVILSEAPGAKPKDLRVPSPLRRSLPALAVTALTLLPLVPWTIRNARTFHVFEPLAPRSATDPGEPVPTGFYRWYRTWAVDFTSTEDVYWNYDGAAIQLADLPARAFDTPTQLAETAAILADYNATTKPSPELDDRFNTLALARIHAHPLRYYVALPAARLANMLLRPRTENLAIPLSWWRFHEHPRQTLFALAYATLNLAYLTLGALGLYRMTHPKSLDPPANPAQSADPASLSTHAQPLAWSMLAYIILRCALLLTLDNSEPRYTLELFPILILAAAALFSRSGPPANSLTR